MSFSSWIYLGISLVFKILMVPRYLDMNVLDYFFFQYFAPKNLIDNS